MKQLPLTNYWRVISLYRISSNNSQGNYFYFRTPKGGDYLREGDYSREAFISNISRRRSYPKYFVLLYQAIKEKVKYMNINIEKTVNKQCFCIHSVVNN